MQLAEAIEPKQQASELVFLTEQPLDRIESLFEDRGVEERFAASLWCLRPREFGLMLGIIP